MKRSIKGHRKYEKKKNYYGVIQYDTAAVLYSFVSTKHHVQQSIILKCLHLLIYLFNPI